MWETTTLLVVVGFVLVLLNQVLITNKLDEILRRLPEAGK